MIEVTLKKTGEKLYFNLKSYQREKSFRNTWYSMEDIDSCQNKQLIVTTDREKKYSFKIYEISNVIFTDREYLYEDDPSNNNDFSKDNSFENPLNHNPFDDDFNCNDKSQGCITETELFNRPSNSFEFNSKDYSFLFEFTPELPLLVGLSPPPEITMPPCLEALKDGKLKFEELPDCAKSNIRLVQKSFSRLFGILPENTRKKLMILYSTLAKENPDVDFKDPDLVDTVVKIMLDSIEKTPQHVRDYMDKKRARGEL